MKNVCIIDSERTWKGKEPHSNNQIECVNTFLSMLKANSERALVLVHYNNIGTAWVDEDIVSKILHGTCSVLIYSTEPKYARNECDRLLGRASPDERKSLEKRIVAYAESVLHNTELSDIFSDVIRLWENGNDLLLACYKAKELRGECFRDQLIAFRILLDCSILLVNPQHEAFAKVSEEVRQMAKQERDASFWSAYWEPVKEFMLVTSPNMTALKLPEEEKNALSRCLRHVAERLSDGEGRPDPDAPCIKDYMVERFSL